MKTFSVELVGLIGQTVQQECTDLKVTLGKIRLQFSLLETEDRPDFVLISGTDNWHIIRSTWDISSVK